MSKDEIIKQAVEKMEADINEYKWYSGLIVRDELLYLIKFIEKVEVEENE